jgi:hypothetical protein
MQSVQYIVKLNKNAGVLGKRQILLQRFGYAWFIKTTSGAGTEVQHTGNGIQQRNNYDAIITRTMKYGARQIDLQIHSEKYNHLFSFAI